MTPKSILNHPPRILPGPQLLHKSINWDENNNNCAIDFTSNGKRVQYSYEEAKLCVSSLASEIRKTLNRCAHDAIRDQQQHIVPLFLPQCPGLYISQLATLETGGAFCPINLDAPQDRIKFVVGDVSARIIITTSQFEELATWRNGPQVLVIDEFPMCITTPSHPSSIFDANPTDLAYVMYTSGSSGTPKGVAVSHMAVTQSLLAHQKHIPQFKRFLQFAAPSFDVSVFEIFFPLVRGSTLVGCDRTQLLNDLPGMITSLNVDAAELTPTVAGSLLQKRANAPCLNLLLTIGEMLTKPIVEEFGGSEAKKSILYGMYGPTEAAIHCNIYPAMPSSAKPGNIGIPLDTVSNFIAVAAKNIEDAQTLDFLPIGEFGELVLCGSQLARGYLNRDEQNKAAFVLFEGRFYYRTGDKAKILEDGSVEIHGRISAGQIKLRGQRVELGEIEEAVFKHSGVKTVVAAVMGSVLIVFVLVNDEGINSEDIIKTCSKWLPTFMVPSEILVLQKLPYLASGKVDKRKLEADYQQHRNFDDHRNLTSMTEMEETLNKLLTELLGPIPSNMRLGAAGLDSLQAIRVSSKLRTLGFNVPTLAILKVDTLQSLATICKKSTSRPIELLHEQSASQPSIIPSLIGHANDIETILSCTPLQLAMLSETAADRNAYRNWIELDLPGVTDSNQVVAAIIDLAQHNSMLRTGFIESENSHGFLQIVWKKFLKSQISRTYKFNYAFDVLKDSIQHPLRIQILTRDSEIRLLLHIHHALYDAWSLELLLDDFNNLLMSRQLAPRPSFSNLVSAHRSGTLLPNDHSTKEYWTDHLAHLDIRAMPSFHSGKRPSRGLSVTRFQTSLSTSAIESKAKQLSSSAQSLFQAAYSVILGSYLGSSDICFGTVFSGRTLPIPGIEDMAGPCLSTLPIRTDLSTSATLKDLVRNINSTNRKHMEYSALSLIDVKSLAGIHSRQQMFDTLLIWQQTLHGHDYTRDHVLMVDTVDHLEFNLTIEILPGKENIELKANYQNSLFPASQIQILLSQIECLIKTILDNDSQSLDGTFANFPNQVMSLENEHPQTNLGPETLSSSVEKVAAQDPDRIAIEFARTISLTEFESEKMTYSELNTRANQMTNHFLDEGVLPNELICICLEKCADLYVSILAVSKMGAGYLPVTPDTPPDRLRQILLGAKVTTVITHSSLSTLFISIPNTNVLRLDLVDFSKFSTKGPPPIIDCSENISYCVFTSGSTGTPKGVLVTHGNLISNLDVLEKLYPTSKHSRLLQSCSQAFDVSVFEIFFTWRIGGCICSAIKDVLFRDIEQAIRVLSVSHLSLTPTVAALVNPDNVPNVQFLVTAGEAVTQKVFNSWAGRGLYQGYGPSETTNICTANPRVSPDDSINNIGRPFKNTSAFVLQSSPKFALVPRGGEGEFCFGGAQVFYGYMNKEQELGRIIEHPKYGRLYRSGDFGRLMPDGTLAFTGRKDDQVKIRGQRVELTEINSTMLRSAKVSDCTTMVIDATGDKAPTLVCFWTSRVGHVGVFETCQPDTAVITKLYRMLESALPVYMIPSALIPVSHLPSTLQGKVDRRLLINKYRALQVNYLRLISRSTEIASDYIWTDLETQIAKGLSELTSTDLRDISPDISFFSLGIDSISAISLASKLGKSTRRSIEISDILKHSSVARLAHKLELRNSMLNPSVQNSTTGSLGFFRQTFLDSIIDKFRKVGKMVSQVLPCTPLQEAMLSAAESSDMNIYSNDVVFELVGNIERIKECWTVMVQRHGILRTCFVITDNPQSPYVQVILSKHDLQFAERATPELFTLVPPYSIQINARKESNELRISMHHALYDAVALEVLYSEVEAYYRGDLLASPAIFAPFLQHMITENLTDSSSFWQGIMDGALPSRLQARKTGTEENRLRDEPHARIQRKVFAQSNTWIKSMLKSHSTSMLAVCHSAWTSVLSLQLYQTDICFGNVVSGRTIPIDGIDRLVAPCFNTLPIRLSNVDITSYLEAFRKFQSLNADSLPFQFTPLRRIQSKYSPDGSRLFDTLFILQQPSEKLDASIWKIKEDNGVMDFPLVCEVVTRKDDNLVEVILHSHTSILSEEDGFQILKTFEENFTAALENPRMQILSPAARDIIAQKSEIRERALIEKAPTPSMSQELTTDEMSIRDIIADFTDLPAVNIGRDVSVFRLGLDSISAVQVATRLRKQGHSVMASDILEHPTIEKLAAYLSLVSAREKEIFTSFNFTAFDEQHRAFVCQTNNIDHSNVVTVRPCTTVQNGMIAQTLHSNGKEYINSIWFELLSSTSVSVFKDAWKIVVAKHEMLRTGFAQIADAVYPFVMVTYRQNFLALPYAESDDQIAAAPENGKDLILPPWSLRSINEDGKTVVQLQIHHALYDAQSMELIISDLSEVCWGKQIAAGQSVSPLLGAILQNSESDLKSKQEFWEREENKIFVNRFPDLTPLRVTSVTTAVQEILSEATIAQLEQSCRSAGLTVQAAAQATWGRLLAAYTGESSTTFGMVLSGRSIYEDADAISFPSIVTLPVRCDVSGTNAELLERTMSSNSLHYKHQFTPLTSIQKWAGYPEGNIFDTLFAYQKLSSETPFEGRTKPWKIIKEEASVNYAISLEVQPTTSGTVILRLTFRDNLIPMEHANLILQQYDGLLLDILRNPHNACDIAPGMGVRLLSITPATQKVLSGPVTLLHQFVERGTQMWPEKVAFEFATCLEAGSFKSQTWTYVELEQESNRVANLLVDRGVIPGQIVGICFDKCAQASFAIIGILKAGCAYVALDPTAPIERLNFIAQDSGTQIILTAGKPGQHIKGEIHSDIINLDDDTILQKYIISPPQLARAVSPGDVSYCLYTSGTTGTPKGCLITHDSAVQAMYSFQILFANHWTSDSKWLQFASFHFDVSVLEQFWSWSVGICVASAPRDLIFEDIPGAIQRLGITHIDLTPSLARMVHPDEVPSLCKGVFITGGEPLKQEILDVWGEHACVYNGYGPTEATIGVTMYPRVPINGNPSNIGPQFQNVGSFVLKPGTALPVLRGGVGELCVSGKLVGKGYLNRPELTAERFPILEPFNERVYRTGDLVRILNDGSFIFLGRADDQVKLRGQRLELTEINEVIKKGIAELDQVVTLVLKHSTQQKEQLVTFYVSTSAYNDSEGEGGLIPRMRDACKSRLPGYMVPTHFIPIGELPLNANNKADSKQLASIYNNLNVDDLQKLSQSQQGKDWDEKEKPVIATISRLLEVEETAITRGSNIFELGVDSISIIRFSRSLQSSGFENAKLSLVKNNPSIEALVMALLGGTRTSLNRKNIDVAASQRIAAFSQRHLVSICSELSVESSRIDCIAPCTPVQEGMIYRFLESDSAIYFNKFEFELEEGVDLKVLYSAWVTVIKQLQVLRTKFIETDDGYAQVVLRPDVKTSQFIFSDYNKLSKSSALKQPFGLEISVTPSGHMKLWIFHGLYDGNSLAMLLRCVVAEYQQVDNVNYGPQFHSSLPFGPLAPIAEAQEFWSKHLKEWSFQPLSHDMEALEDTVATSQIESLDNFETLRKQLGVSHQSIIQAAWISALHTIKLSSVTIGIITSGRAIDFEGAEQVIGPLFNTIPFDTKLGPSINAKELILRCHEFNMKMHDFQHTPLKDIQKWSPAKPGESLFDTLFVFQRPEEGDENFADGVWKQVDGGQEADYPLAFEATLSPDSCKLDLTIVAQGSYVSPDSAGDLIARFKSILQNILSSNAMNTIEGIASTGYIQQYQPEIQNIVTDDNLQQFGWNQQSKQIRTEITTLAKISEDLVHESSSIFELGLDSIDVIKLSSRLKRIGIEISVSAMIKCQSITNMMRKISTKFDSIPEALPGELLGNMSQDLISYLEKSQKYMDAEDILPATPLQQGMVNEMMQSGYRRYFTIEAFRLGTGVELERLKFAVRTVIDHSQILRTRFAEILDPRSPVSFAQIIHTRNSEYAQSIMKTRKLAMNQTIQSFLEAFTSRATKSASKYGRLLQITFLHGGDAQYMVMAISHALYDGSSLRTIHEDISRAYGGSFVPRPDYKPFLEQVFKSTSSEAQKFWKATVSSLPPSVFPRKEAANPNQVDRREQRSRVSLKDIEALCKSSKITMQTIGQTCWALVLAQLMGQLDVVFGSVLSCRDTEEAGEVMFPLMNTVAVRSVIHGTMEELLRYMQEMSDSTRQYQHFPLGTAQAYALASRAGQNLAKDTTLFDTLFIYQGRRSTATPQYLYESMFGVSDVEFPVCVEMEVLDNEFLTWTTACKSGAAVETNQIIEYLESVLEHLLSSPHAQVIYSDTNGTSVCGLPRFKSANKKPQTQQNLEESSQEHTEWTSTEINIRKALHDLSEIPEEKIKKDSTIFHLGLDSILILKLPALLKSSGINLRVSEILREQTVTAMAEAAERSNKQPVESIDVNSILRNATAHIDIAPYRYELERAAGPIEEILPVTSGQLFMIRQWQFSRGALFYSTFTYTIPVRINKARLDRAWRFLLQRHEMLRTGFIEIDSEFVQVVYQAPHNDVVYQPQGAAPMRRHDLAYPPINLILEEGKDVDAQLKLVIHHALYDGISLPTIIEELQVLYRLEDLESPTLKFRDFVAHSFAVASKESIKERWISYLHTDKYANTERARIDNTRTEVFHPSTPISNMRQTAQSTGVSIDALLLATISKVRAQRMQIPSISHIIIGIYHSNRASFGTDFTTLCAPTLNLLPLIVHEPLRKSILEIAKDVQRDLQLVGSAEMSSVSLEQIYEWTGERVDFWVNILKDTAFAEAQPLENESENGWRGVDLEVRRRSEVRNEVPNEQIEAGKGEAFIPSIDVELRYTTEGKIDIGVFAPAKMLGLKEAEGMIGDFIGFWA